MKKIKSFNDFSLDQTNEEINLRNLAAGAAIAASTLLPGKALANTEPGDTLHKTTRSKSEMEIMTKYQHWTLDSTHVDTLYRKVKEEGKALIYADTLDLGVDGDLFLTGNFNLNSGVRDFTAFWSNKSMKIDLSDAKFLIKVKKIDGLKDWQWEKDFLNKQIAKPWIDGGYVEWKDKKFISHIKDIESL